MLSYNLLLKINEQQIEPIYEFFEGIPTRLKHYPYCKPDDPRRGAIKVGAVAPFNQIKSAKYLFDVFGKVTGRVPNLVSDYDIQNKLDISFCSIGGQDNEKTVEVLEKEENRFLTFGESGAIITKIQEEKEKKNFVIEEKERDQHYFCHKDDGYGYGFILKVIPKKFPKRVWICVAGIGEWDTSGAVWYLANHWREMPESGSFGLIVKVRFGQDESAEKVYLIREKTFWDRINSPVRKLFKNNENRKF